MSHLATSVDESVEPDHEVEVSESAFEFLLSEILLQPDYLTLDPVNNKNDIHLHLLDILGYDVGYRYAEKIAAYQRFTATEPLDLIKFICTEFWEEVFKKKIDKLQTNHRGVFVLSDLKFKWLDRYVADDATSRRAASNMLHFPCGIVRGALANLGITSIVNADVNDLPACSFSIRVKPA